MSLGTTQRPQDNESCRYTNVPELANLPFSPISFLQELLQDEPELRLKPDSLLAAAVLFEYNTASGPTNRPLWPENICGYIESLQQEAGIDRTSRNAVQINGIPDTEYEPDNCLNQTILVPSEIFTGSLAVSSSQLPGTVAYAKCEDGDNEDPFESLFTADWTQYFKRDAFPELGDPNLNNDLTPEQQESISEMFRPEVDLFLTGGTTTVVVLNGDESSGFVWKPASEGGNGSLVVLIPNDYAELFDGDATITGDFGSETSNRSFVDPEKNGGRPHYYFSQPGIAYGSNITFSAPLKGRDPYVAIIGFGGGRGDG